MCHRGQTPEGHRKGVTPACAKAVDESAYDEHSHRVRRLKRKNQIAVLDFIPAEIVLQGGLQYAQQLAIHVVFCYAEKRRLHITQRKFPTAVNTTCCAVVPPPQISFSGALGPTVRF